VTLLCMFFLLGTQIWSCFMRGPTEYNAFFASKFFAGFFGQVSQILAPLFLVDMFFLHQRGRAFTILGIVSLFPSHRLLSFPRPSSLAIFSHWTLTGKLVRDPRLIGRTQLLGLHDGLQPLVRRVLLDHRLGLVHHHRRILSVRRDGLGALAREAEPLRLSRARLVEAASANVPARLGGRAQTHGP
jgi:hypothetical protein